MKDVTGAKDMAGVEDVMSGVKDVTGTEDVTRVNGTTGAGKEAETAKKGISHAGGRG